MEYRDNDKGVFPLQQIEELSSKRVYLRYKKGENVCKHGAYNSSIIFINRGLVRIYRDEMHTSSTLFLKKDGDLIGLETLFTREVFLYSAEALSELDVTLYDCKRFKEYLLKEPEMAKEVIKRINIDIAGILDRLYSLSTKHVYGRLAELLLFLEHKIYASNPFRLTLSKTDLAEITATSKESMSRLFQELKRDGIITEKDHSIEIVDEEKLKRISETG